MASFFNLVLDTTAPAGLTLSINSGATYTSSTAVALAIGITDTPTTGYQMKIWGTSTVATEALATWETFATSKNITLSSGDGLKTVSIRVRDDVGNETSIVTSTITLDTAVPMVTVTGPDVSRISKVEGFNASVVSFVSNTAFVEYKVKEVPSTSSLHDAGTLIPTTNGSVNTSGTGAFAANTAISVTIKGADLELASSGDGTKIIKIFVKTAAGLWSVA